MVIPRELIIAIPPSPDLLLERARRRTDDWMLMEIARADYGQMADEMMAQLRPIRDKGIVPSPMDGQLIEVLSLTRWCNPEAPNSPPFEPGPSGHRGHQARFFACAVLLRSGREPASADSTLALGLASAKVLGDEMSEAIGRFLTWQLMNLQIDHEPLLFAVGLLVVATRLRAGRITDAELGKVAEWVLEEESLDRGAFPSRSVEPRPLAFSIQQGFWRPLAEEIKCEAATIAAEDVRTKLQLCSLLLETPW